MEPLDRLRGAVMLWVHLEERLGPFALDEEHIWIHEADVEAWLAKLFDTTPETVRDTLAFARARVAPEVQVRDAENQRRIEEREKRRTEEKARQAEEERRREEAARQEMRARWARERRERERNES